MMMEQHRKTAIKVWLTAAHLSEQKLRSISQAAKTLDLSGFFPVVSIISQAPWMVTMIFLPNNFGNQQKAAGPSAWSFGVKGRAAHVMTAAVVTGDRMALLCHSGCKLLYDHFHTALTGRDTFLAKHTDFQFCILHKVLL